jgi:hypothetical protein
MRPIVTALLFGVFLSTVAVAVPVQRPAAPIVEVFKSPTCGCCSKWVEHMRSSGFDVRSTNVSDLSSVKKTHRVPDKLLSCHTATVNGYVIEGHVPAGDVQRLLKERPAVAGIAVPDMPAGSPGMEVEGMKAQPFNVLSFDKQGMTKIFARH